MGEKKVVDWTALVAWCDSNDIPKSTRGDLYTIMAKADAQHERIVAGLEADARRYRFLRDNHVREWFSDMPATKGAPSLDIDFEAEGHDLDAAIDAFLAQTAEG